MSDNSTIEWTESTWNPTVGCAKVSPGCDNCYAIRTAARFQSSPAYAGTVHRGQSGLDWTGTVRSLPDRLDAPLHWAKPRRIFVNSMSDLFHDDVTDDFIAQVFAVMALAHWHTFQCLTKRHGRMRSLLSSQTFRHQVARAIDASLVDQDHDPEERWAPIPGFDGYEASTHGRLRSENDTILKSTLNPVTGRPTTTLWNHGQPKTMPVHRLVLLAHGPTPDEGAEVCHRNGDKVDNRLANLRWGTRSENQREKVRHGARGGPQKLSQEQVAEIRRARSTDVTQQRLADSFGVSRSLISMVWSGHVWAEPEIDWPLPNVWLGVSVEDQKRADLRIPALLDTPAAVRWISAEPLLGPVDLTPYVMHQCDCAGPGHSRRSEYGPALDWVVAGGESGPGARPMHPGWARTLRDQCVEAGVPYFFKQWGNWAPAPWHGEDGATHAFTASMDDTGMRHFLRLSHGPTSGERDLTTPYGAQGMREVGKKAAGRLLDGRTWDEYPHVHTGQPAVTA